MIIATRQYADRERLVRLFHNMALTCPVTSSEDVARHSSAFRDAVASLYA